MYERCKLKIPDDIGASEEILFLDMTPSGTIKAKHLKIKDIQIHQNMKCSLAKRNLERIAYSSSSINFA